MAFCGVMIPTLIPHIEPAQKEEFAQQKSLPLNENLMAKITPIDLVKAQPPVFVEKKEFIPPVQVKPQAQLKFPNLPKQPEQLYPPDSAVFFAEADMRTIPESLRPSIRYLSLYNIPRAKRREVAAIVSFMVNSLGTRRKPYIPLFVGGCEETLIRLNIDDYEWNPKSWDDLAKNGSGPRPSPEPYFHAFIEKTETVATTQKVKKKVRKEVTREVRTWEPRFNGYSVRNVTEFVEVDEFVDEPVTTAGKKNIVFDRAPWLNDTKIRWLEDETHSIAPILRADWFIVNSSVPPAYYNFLRLGNNIKDFDNLVFSNEELAKKARSQDRAVAITSIVARNNRILLRSPTFTGGYRWSTRDFLQSVGLKQVIKNPLLEESDATEDIGSLPNGLQAYFVTNDKRERQDFANPDIAIDNTSIDHVVRTGRSCIVCHAEGIRPIDDEVRTLTKQLRNQEQVNLLIAKEEDARRIEDLFYSDLDEQIIKDGNIYAAAVARTNGLKPEVNAKIFNEIYNFYAETLLTKEIIALDIGVSVDEMDKYIKLSNDPVVLGLLKTPIRPVRRDQWERSFSGMMLVTNINKALGFPVRQEQIILQTVPVYVPKH